MREPKKQAPKLNLIKFYESIGTEELRAMRDDITEELKARAREARKNRPPQKPEYRFWNGKITRRIGGVFSRYRFAVTPSDIDQLPECVRDKADKLYYSLMSGEFKKDICPKIGDDVILRFRVLKRTNIAICFSNSRIFKQLPKAVVGCKREWNCLNTIVYDDKSQCPNCPDAIM